MSSLGVLGLICRFCGSDNLIWDHGVGYVVCASCGSVVEELLDDGVRFSSSPALKPRFSAGFHSFRFKGGGSVDRFSLITSLINSRALNILSSYPVVRFALELVDSNPVLKARTLRGRVALALYLVYRALGYSKSRSRVLASRALRVSPKTIERVERWNKSVLGVLEVKAKDMLISTVRERRQAKAPLIS
jgi:transcription initiation factor TFIIIB Brf1 subunit/transcription initiation factor TFIIB